MKFKNFDFYNIFLDIFLYYNIYINEDKYIISSYDICVVSLNKEVRYYLTKARSF